MASDGNNRDRQFSEDVLFTGRAEFLRLAVAAATGDDESVAMIVAQLTTHPLVLRATLLAGVREHVAALVATCGDLDAAVAWLQRAGMSALDASEEVADRRNGNDSQQ